MFHACIKVQKPSVCRWSKCWRRCIGAVGGKNSYGHFWKHRKSILNICRFLDIVCHNRMRKNDIIHDQRLRKHSCKKSKVEDWSFNKNVSIKQKSKNIEISTFFSLEVWLFWCEKGMLSEHPKWLPSKLIKKIYSYELRYFNFRDTPSW